MNSACVEPARTTYAPYERRAFWDAPIPVRPGASAGISRRNERGTSRQCSDDFTESGLRARELGVSFSASLNKQRSASSFADAPRPTSRAEPTSSPQTSDHQVGEALPRVNGVGQRGPPNVRLRQHASAASRPGSRRASDQRIEDRGVIGRDASRGQRQRKVRPGRFAA
jgi:hypothetical protein